MACPVDGAAVRLQDGILCCTADPTHRYSFEAGILRFVPADRRAAVESQSQAHEAACDAQGWHSPDEAEFKSLPQTGLSGYPMDYWPQQADATAQLWGFFWSYRAEKRRGRRWSSRRSGLIGLVWAGPADGLDVAGYATLALDARAGERHGLGVYPFSRYLRVQVDPLQLPLARGAFDSVIFQETLSFFGDDAARKSILDQALRALRPGGWVAVMDSLSPSREDVEDRARLVSRRRRAGAESAPTAGRAGAVIA